MTYLQFGALFDSIHAQHASKAICVWASSAWSNGTVYKIFQQGEDTGVPDALSNPEECWISITQYLNTAELG